MFRLLVISLFLLSSLCHLAQAEQEPLLKNEDNPESTTGRTLAQSDVDVTASLNINRITMFLNNRGSLNWQAAGLAGALWDELGHDWGQA
ncbi:MAG: hypothetical protein ACRDGA_10340, partial [Bacteroidota bacterium]